MAQAAVSLGLLLPTREMVMAPGTPDLNKMLELAERAEELGFDSVWVGDSILARPRLEALTTLAAVAARTRRVKLGTAVFLSALRHPVVLANEVANVDMLSKGRLIFGLGIATKNRSIEQEFAACGVSFARRISLFEDGLTIMRRLWTEPSVTFTSRHFQLTDVRLGLRPVQQRIPLWIAGSVDNALRRVLRLGDGWFPNPPSPEKFAALSERLHTLAGEMGRDVRDFPRAVYTTLNINSNVAQAQQELQTFMEGYYGVPYEVMSRQQGGCAGTAEHCANWLNRFIAAGARTLVIRIGGPDQFGQLERCAREVVPALQRA
jgi:probable F420-dependent oxidoreductase